MGFPTFTISGTATSGSGFNSATGTFTARITGNDDGTVSGTWTLVGTYQSFYGFGTESLSGTLTGTGSANGPWSLTLNADGVTSGPVTLSLANGQYVLDVSMTFGVDVLYSGGYGDVFTYHVVYPTTAHLAAAAPISTVATDGPDLITGTSGNDVIAGLAGNDTLIGGDGNDTITGGAGNDSIDGGNGIDSAIFSDVRANYTITNQGNGVFTVAHTGSDGTDTLVNVERLVFADSKVAIDIDGHAGQAFRLYQAAFHRLPDLPGLGFQMNDLDVGWSLSHVAANFVASPEFQATYGNVSDLQFVQLLYQNVLHRVGEDAGVQFHMNELASGETRGDVLSHFSESPENKANVIGEIVNGMVYVWP